MPALTPQWMELGGPRYPARGSQELGSMVMTNTLHSEMFQSSNNPGSWFWYTGLSISRTLSWRSKHLPLRLSGIKNDKKEFICLYFIKAWAHSTRGPLTVCLYLIHFPSQCGQFKCFKNEDREEIICGCFNDFQVLFYL